MQLYEKSPDLDAMSVIYAGQAMVLLEVSESDLITLGIAPHMQLIEAKRVALLALEAAETAESPDGKKDVLYALGLIHEQQRNYKDTRKFGRSGNPLGR